MSDKLGRKPTKLTLPYPTVKTKKGVNLLSANIYRNAHFYSLASAKKAYAKICYAVFEDMEIEPFDKPVMIEYKLFFKGKRRRDIDNFWFPVSKFLNDALVEKGILEDDDARHIPYFLLEWGGEADDNYVEVTIKELNG